MTVVKPYPLTVRLMPGESLRSFMHRLALKNKFPYMNWIITDLGMQNIGTALTPQQLCRLATISSTPFQVLKNRQDEIVHGKGLSPKDFESAVVVDRRASRLCLLCFRDQGFHKAVWDLTAVTVCPLHGVPIIRNCPECGAQLHWRRNNLHECPRRHKLIDYADKVEPIAFDDALDGVRAIIERVETTPAWPSLLRQLPEEIRSLPLRDFIDALEVVGCINQEPTKSSLGGHRAYWTVPNYHLVLARGYRIFSDWPDGLHRLLDLFPGHDQGLAIANTSCPPRLHLHSRLARHRERAFGQIIGREIWNYAEKHRVTLTAGAFGFTPADFESTFVNGAAASALLHASIETIQRCALREKWSGARQLLTGKHVWLRRSDLDAWRKSHQGALSATRLSQRFHVLQKTVRAAAARGLFGSLSTERKGFHRKREWHALPSEVDAFLSSIRTRIERAGGKQSIFYVTWMGFTKRPEYKKVCFSAILEGVINGTVRAAEMHGEDLSTLRFHVVDALKLSAPVTLRDEITLRVTPFPLRNIVQYYSVHHLLLVRAIELGILSARCHGSSISRYWVTYADMDEFLKRFTTIGLIARQFSISEKSVCDTLRSAAVLPFHRNNSRRQEPMIFKWDDIRSAGLFDPFAAAKKSKSQGRSRTVCQRSSSASGNDVQRITT
jgi:hypothetical protein